MSGTNVEITFWWRFTFGQMEGDTCIPLHRSGQPSSFEFMPHSDQMNLSMQDLCLDLSKQLCILVFCWRIISYAQVGAHFICPGGLYRA
eukprot:1158097-Pelagomonas_calceolata.AAC.6